MLYDKRWDVKQGDYVLLGAADYINRHGWCQKDFIREDHRVCVLGAILQASDGCYEVYSEAYKKLKKHLGISCISTWNDKPDRNQDQVIEALMGAAYDSVH